MRLSDWTAAEVAAKLSGSGKQQSKKVGNEWKAPCPAHDDGTPSLFLKDGNGGKLLYYCFGGCEAEDVRAAIEAKLSGEEPTRRSGEAPREREKAEDPRKTVCPVPDDAKYGFDDFQHSTYGSPSGLWTYRLADGSIAGWVARYDLGDGEKEFAPFVWTRHEHSGKQGLVMRSMTAQRPLYNLDRIAANPDAVICFNEGEKSADAAGALFPDWVPTTLPGGSKAIRLVDLEPLAGRTVVVIADHDGPGYELLLQLHLTVPSDTDLRMLVWPETWPAGEREGQAYERRKGDDAADAAADGWTTELLRQAVRDSGMPLIHRIEFLPEPFELSHRR